MLRTVIVGSSKSGAGDLRHLAAASGLLELVSACVETPSSHELQRQIAIAPEVVLLELPAGRFPTDIAQSFRQSLPNSLLIGYGETSEAFGHLLHGLISRESTAEEFAAVIREATLRKGEMAAQRIFSFLPTKAGSGCTTVVLNTAVSLKRDYGSRVLVMDADLRSSAMSAMTGCVPPQGIEHLLADVKNVNTTRMDEFIVRWQGVDLMISRRSLDTRAPEWVDYLHLLRLVSERYDIILVDLPELVNPATVHLVRNSQSVFAVCTPEMPSLLLAKQRIHELRKLQIPSDKYNVLMNRWHRSDPVPEELSTLLNERVQHMFPNDYGVVRDAIAKGMAVRQGSRLGSSFHDFAGTLLPAAVQTTTLGGKLRQFFRIV